MSNAEIPPKKPTNSSVTPKSGESDSLPSKQSSMGSTSIRLEYDKKNNRLKAVVSTSETPSSLNLEQFRRYIDEEGYNDLALSDTVLINVLKKAELGETGAFELGKRQQKVSVSLYVNGDDQLCADLDKAKSEKAPTVDIAYIKALIEKKGFSAFKIKASALEALLTQADQNSYGTVVLGAKPTNVDITFSYNEENRILNATLSPSESSIEISFASLQELIARSGYDNHGVESNAVSDLVTKAKRRQYGTYKIGEKPAYTQVRFTLSEDTGELSAELALSEEEILFNRSWIQEQLAEQGYEHFFFHTNALDKLFTHMSNNEWGSYVIGEKHDASVLIEFDDDLMSAYITVSPPSGGADIDEKSLTLAIEASEVDRNCCDADVLKTIINDKQSERCLLASGKKPVEGQDAIFKALVEEVTYREQKESKSGRIDHKDLMDFTLVEPGVPLMKRIPGTAGVNGHNVKGHAIPAEEIDDTEYPENLPGVQVSPKDPNTLISATKGHPVILPNGVRVDNTIIVNNVDISTGNISYDGSLMVKGEIMPGMSVKVTGDIVVQGVVTRARLYAKNNITIHCGVIGADPAKEQENDSEAVLKAGGNITAQYINLAKVSAGRDIEVKEYLSHCKSDAKNQVIVGQNGGKGRVFGGECHAQKGIIVNSIGADGGVKTLVSVGTPESQTKQFKQLSKSHDNRIEQANQLNGILKKYMASLKINPTDTEKLAKTKAIQKVLTDISQEVSKMESTIKSIERVFKTSRYAEVKVQKTTFPNVNILINGAEFIIRQEAKGGIFVKDGKDVRWKNL